MTKRFDPTGNTPSRDRHPIRGAGPAPKPNNPQPPKNKGGGGDGKPGNKGGGNGGNLRYGAYGGYKGVARKSALKFVNADIRRLKRDTRNDVRQERRQFQRERGDIKHVAKGTLQNVRHLRQDTSHAYDQAVEQSNAAQQALSQQLAANSGAIQGGANSELARLGLGGSDATGQMTADAAYSQQTAAQNSLDNSTNLGMASANSRALSNLMLGSIKGERLSQIGQARNLRDENVSQLRDALHEAQAGRGDAVNALLAQMAQSGWAQYMDQANLNLQRQALKKYGSSSGVSSSYTPYTTSSYQPTYGYGYSSSSGSSGSSYSSSGTGSGTANAAKMSLYQKLLGLKP